MSRPLPSEREALALLRKSGCPPDVIRHCRAVARLAVTMTKRCRDKGMDVDLDLVKIGALLHDIGRSKTHGVNHGVLGAGIAGSSGLPSGVIAIIQRHIGGGITAEEARSLGWPEGDYMPETIEEKIVAYADKLMEGSKEISIDRVIRDFEKKLGSEHAAIGRLKRLHEEMSSVLSDPP